jgi:hypothetical protein
VSCLLAVQVLHGAPPGTFLVRFSQSAVTGFAVAFVEADGSVHQVLVRSVVGKGFELDGGTRLASRGLGRACASGRCGVCRAVVAVWAGPFRTAVFRGHVSAAEVCVWVPCAGLVYESLSHLVAAFPLKLVVPATSAVRRCKYFHGFLRWGRRADR